MNELTTQDSEAKILEQVLVAGDVSKLNPQLKVAHLKMLCESLSLNYLTSPFAYIRMQGKEVLYATKSCTDQLRKRDRVSVKIIARELLDDLYVVTAEASMPDGRTDVSIGAVALQGLKGDAKANAFMRAETKAKRRVTLSICGLSMLDESELETIPGATAVNIESPKEIPPTPPASHLGDYVVQIGKKYKGLRLRDIPPLEIKSFADWLYKQAEEKNNPLRDYVAEFYDNAMLYLDSLREKSKEDNFNQIPDEEKLPFEKQEN